VAVSAATAGAVLASRRPRHPVGWLLLAWRGELLAVVDQTMQPTRASLWLRPRGPASPTDGTAAHQLLSRSERDPVRTFLA
jgi:hypothetical protein